MDAYVICLLFLSKQISAVADNEKHAEAHMSHDFIAAIVNRSTKELVSLGAVLSPHWVLTVAHAFPSDTYGLDFNKYEVMAGRPLRNYTPVFGMTHPAYTWDINSAEDFALFRVESKIDTQPVLISGGRFPWNFLMCDFIYWSEHPSEQGSLRSLPVETTVLRNCLTMRKRRANGLNQFYLDDLLCAKAGKNEPHECMGQKGGILFCQNLLVGLLLRKEWCKDKTANFTDVGRYTNWLHSRVSDGGFIQLDTDRSSAAVERNGDVLTMATALWLSCVFLLW